MEVSRRTPATSMPACSCTKPVLSFSVFRLDATTANVIASPSHDSTFTRNRGEITLHLRSFQLRRLSCGPTYARSPEDRRLSEGWWTVPGLEQGLHRRKRGRQ